jgi:hypothetical protein
MNIAYGKLGDVKRKSSYVVPICLGLILTVLVIHLSVVLYVLSEGNRVLGSMFNADAVASLSKVPIGDMADWTKETFYEVKKSPVDETMKNIHDSSVKVKSFIFTDLKETVRKMNRMSDEAYTHRSLFSNTLQLTLDLQEPLKSLRKILNARNQDDLRVILDKLRSSFERVNDDDVHVIVDRVKYLVSENNVREAMMFIRDADGALKKSEKLFNKVHDIAEAI